MPPQPEQEAQILLEDFGFDSLPIEPQDICSAISEPKMDFEVVYSEQPFSDKKFEGMCIKNRGSVGILINSSERLITRRRFTAAHEVAHAVLHVQEGVQNDFRCTKKDIQGNSDATNNLEKEANEFASALLMPNKLLQPYLRENDLTWVHICKVAKKCKTSLIATARRLVDLSTESYALIVHDDLNKRSWSTFKSKNFSYFLPRRAYPLDSDYIEIKNFDSSMPDYFDESDTNEWLDFSSNDIPDSIQYSSIFLVEYGLMYTMILLDE